MSKEWEPESIFDVLASRTARTILERANEEPMSAQDLAAVCDASLPTVYRRVNVLQEYDLLTEQTEPNAGGNDYSVYRTNLERITVDLDGTEFAVDVSHDRDIVDRFSAMWADLEAKSKSRASNMTEERPERGQGGQGR